MRAKRAGAMAAVVVLCVALGGSPMVPPVERAGDWPRYHYTAHLVRAIDGDTAELAVDLGFCVSTDVHVRLLGIDTPELHGPDRTRALAAKDRLETTLRGRELFVRTERDRQTFTRYLADVFYARPDGTPRNVVDDLRDAGF